MDHISYLNQSCGEQQQVLCLKVLNSCKLTRSKLWLTVISNPNLTDSVKPKDFFFYIGAGIPANFTSRWSIHAEPRIWFAVHFPETWVAFWIESLQAPNILWLCVSQKSLMSLYWYLVNCLRERVGVSFVVGLIETSLNKIPKAVEQPSCRTFLAFGCSLITTSAWWATRTSRGCIRTKSSRLTICAFKWSHCTPLAIFTIATGIIGLLWKGSFWTIQTEFRRRWTVLPTFTCNTCGGLNFAEGAMGTVFTIGGRIYDERPWRTGLTWCCSNSTETAGRTKLARLIRAENICPGRTLCAVFLRLTTESSSWTRGAHPRTNTTDCAVQAR